MVHQTINTSMAPALKASSKISSMCVFLRSCGTVIAAARSRCFAGLPRLWHAGLVLWLTACAVKGPHKPVAAPGESVPVIRSPVDANGRPLPPQENASGEPRRSQLLPVPWSDLPGWEKESMAEVWSVLLGNCERPGTVMAEVCPHIRRLALADDSEQRLWLMHNLQAHRVLSLDGEANGLLTAYYEPVMEARRVPGNGFSVPLYRPPAGLKTGQPWFTRQEIDTQQTAQAALHGREIAWLADPVDAMVLHIQGSGRLRITEGDGRVRVVRVGFAASNEHPYQSIGRWLLDNNEIKDASWPGIKAWLQRNPGKLQTLLWVNPRYVFFKEEPITDSLIGPRGAQGLPLTPGRSIAVDPQSLEYGTPVWMVSPGPTQSLQRLVVAQDTGSAIVGAVRADLYMGTGAAAGELAGRMKQPLRLWALLPKTQ